MRVTIFLFLASVLLAGCAAPTQLPVRELRKPPLAAMSRSPYPNLKLGLDTLLADTLFPPSNAGIKIVSLSRHETLYELNPDMLFNPASNNKLFTASAALTSLGESFPLKTLVLADTAERLLTVRGCGDPLLKTTDLDSLAGLIRQKIRPEKTWRLRGDVSYFDDLYWGAGWTWDEEPSSYGMFVSPIILNNNTIDVRVLPGLKPGDQPLVSLNPPTAYLSVENQAVTVVDTVRKPLDISRKWRERSNVITVQGEVLLKNHGSSTSLSVLKPELYAMTVLAEKLVERGIRISGIETDTIRAGGMEIASYSHRLDSAVTFMNKVSDNLTAEALLKMLAAEKFGTPGSATAGTSAVCAFLNGIGIDTTKIAQADGSGLSRYNLTSPSVIIRLLQAMERDTVHFPAFYFSLPIAGVDGTIAKRMRGTRAEGNLRAKTGSLSAVSALSGYVRTADGEPLAFSILMQNFPGSVRGYRITQDRIGVLLSEIRRRDF
jgi:D-alanyl-D-alanine carboxypeptidase/D-alanyl-D-alanine-endopeptidase (penicillin-binding protein 4)